MYARDACRMPLPVTAFSAGAGAPSNEIAACSACVPGMANPTRPLPPLDLLLGFESAARHLSFTRAAGELFLTQSAVSRQIQSPRSSGRAYIRAQKQALALTDPVPSINAHGTIGQLRRTREGLRETRRSRVTLTTRFIRSYWLVPRLAALEAASERGREHQGDARSRGPERGGIDPRCANAERQRPPTRCTSWAASRRMCSPEYGRNRARPAGRVKPEDLRHHVSCSYTIPAGMALA